MVAVGLVLLVLAALLTLGTIFFNGAPVAAKVFGISLSHVSIGGLFLAGIVTGLVGALGLFLMLGGGLRRRRKTVQRKREVQGARGQASTLEQENARLQEELEQTRASGRPAERAPLSADQPGSAQRKDFRGQ